MESFLGRLSSLASKFHIRSDGQVNAQNGYDPDAYAAYPEYEQQATGRQQAGYGQRQGTRQADEYADAYDQGGYEEPGYETSYGDGYTSAGARPRNPARPKGEGLLSGLKSRFQRQEPPEYAPQPPMPDNVVPINGRSEAAAPSGYPYGQYEARAGGWQQADAEPMPASRRESSGKTLIQLVRRLEDAEDIIEHMISGGKVIVNMEEIDDALKQRMVDMVSGAAYALQYKVKRFAYRNYLVAPNDEDIVSNVSTPEPVQDTYEEAPARTSSRRFY